MNNSPTILKSKSKHKVSGDKKSGIKLFTDAKVNDINGNPLPLAVAMVAQCVAFYRKKMKPLKTIYLCPQYYNAFDYWWRKIAIEREGDCTVNLATFDGVEINQMERGHILKSQQGDASFDWDFYPNETKQVIN